MTKQERAEHALAKLERERKEAGVCRHCGGVVPCWSSFGDQRVGVRHSDKSYARMRSRGVSPGGAQK